VTATRDRDSDLDTDTGEVEWDERPMFGRRRGLPWWVAVLLALGLSAVSAMVDSSRLVDDTRLTALGLYQVAFLAGCVLAVLAVRRRNLFGPIVQPPLIFAATFVPVQLTARTSTGAETGTKKVIFEVGLPMASSFPWMAGATAATIVLGIIRQLVQRDPTARASHVEDADDDRPRRDSASSRPPRRPAEDRPAKADATADRASRGDRPAQQQKRRESSAPRPRPSRDRDDRADRDKPDRADRADRGDRGERGNRGEAPQRRNAQRPRGQGAKPRGAQPRRPRED
jgi:hypothetical protein